jgi:hypothetical protein
MSDSKVGGLSLCAHNPLERGRVQLDKKIAAKARSLGEKGNDLKLSLFNVPLPDPMGVEN